MEFSVIVPVYNAEPYLTECVGSVLAQTHADWELILVDDGSADGSAALCDAAAENTKIRALHRANGGQLTARLDGVEAARGDYCVFLDADDLLEPRCLETLHTAIEAYRAPDMVIYSYFRVSPDGSAEASAPLFPAQRLIQGDGKKELYTLFFTGTALNNVWTKTVKRTVFAGDYPDYAPFADLRVAEDRLLSMGLMTNAGRIVCITDRLLRYRVFPGSITREFTPTFAERFNVSRLYPAELAYLQQWGLFTPDMLHRLNAGFISHTLYVLEHLYRNIPDKADRRKLLGYPWKQFLPEECLADHQTNPCLNDVQKRLLAMLLQGDRKGLQRHFARTALVKKLRAAKRKLTSR